MDCGTEIQALLSGQYLYKKFSSVFVVLLFQFPVLSNVYFLFFFHLSFSQNSSDLARNHLSSAYQNLSNSQTRLQFKFIEGNQGINLPLN